MPGAAASDGPPPLPLHTALSSPTPCAHGPSVPLPLHTASPVTAPAPPVAVSPHADGEMGHNPSHSAPGSELWRNGRVARARHSGAGPGARRGGGRARRRLQPRGDRGAPRWVCSLFLVQSAQSPPSFSGLHSLLLGKSAQMAATVPSGSSRGGNRAGWQSESGGAAAELGGGGSNPGCHQRGCKAVPEAELPKDLPAAFLMCQGQGTECSMRSDCGCDLEKSEFCAIHSVWEKLLHPQEGPAAAVPHLPGAQEASWHKQGDSTCERAVSAGVENGFCIRDGSVRQPVAPQGTSAAADNEYKMNLRRFLGEWFRSQPVGTAVLILLLLVPVLALGAALAVLAAPQVPVTPATPLSLLCCPPGWVGYKGVCYYFSLDYSTWDQGQERCSELNASLAIAKDEEAMDLLSRLSGNVDYWLGLRRRGERLQWGDGSSYSSRVPVSGNSECAYLDERRLRSDNCSNERPYLCSKAHAPL
ncbi:uncharacterized protein LOC141729659 isoform X2 [Zonotrichia albicollis]|uniref:uncharacterized protein LOC141729659 isoform X2 n=1 Tax=Zonotrichia albicollis TaxID=44394 RepID=UPI003D80D1F2